ncbi:MAG: DNA polymerase III subunit gamma/tau [Paludibacteraceae bacterium]|nr:DNA polymerase III subunit gamma/tau [Paludibacteraceae bacterium]
MENFVVSARKYRPSTFESVVGQKALTQTLKNTIKNNHLAHAYLFCGPRGVGKTTCARIFAKTINCEHPTGDFEPCNECASCKAFNEQRSFNIHELDAASNNSVDDIRSIIDQVRIPPQIGKYSVYIVDEVHMLSQGAFNAFLKTLEEPPAHAIFILATTEKHKILTTILSRCQIYEFNRITISDTVQHLANIARKEDVEIDTESLHTIALKSDGGMRDALSIFDQLVNFCGNKISYEDTIQTLNVLDRDYYFNLLDTCMEGNVTKALLLLNEILKKGFEGQHFLDGFASHIRDVMVSKNPETIILLETAETIAQRYKAQAAKLPLAFLYKALQATSECSFNYRLSRNKRLAIEILLIKLCQINDTPLNTPPTNPKATPSSNNVQSRPANTPSTTGTNYNTTNNGIKDNTNKEPTNTADKSVSFSVPQPVQKSAQQLSKRPQQHSISINESSVSTSKQEQTTTEQTQGEPIEKKNNEFTLEQLQKTWVQAISAVAKDDERLKSTLRKHYPELKDNTTLLLTLNNESQVTNLKEEEKRLLYFLRSALQNDYITFQYSIHATEDDTPYTSEDKIKYFTQNNPDIEILKNELKLQIE